ncbi:MAG: hypothetical protein OZ921_16840 [Sorangiineae bacterium]|nr:hypothetical protein [Polyangiaceae bacterium]MEB2324182.1 hypothetical protein [Sorangiineae bacterium]
MSPRFVALALGILALGCQRAPRSGGEPPRRDDPPAKAPPLDAALEECRARIRDLEREPAAPGAPAFEARRAELLGRARGEPLLWLREPEPTPDAALTEPARAARRAYARSSPWRRVGSLRARFRAAPAILRSLILREGYLYSNDPTEALALVSSLRVEDLFDESEVLLERGAARTRLTRVVERRRALYRDSNGREAELLFGDRLVLDEAELARALALDLGGLADTEGVERLRVERLAAGGVLGELRLGGEPVRALLVARGASLELSCLDAPEPVRARLRAWQESDAARRRGLRRLREAITDGVAERLPFDRPRGEEGEEFDGQMRNEWRWAYQTGRSAYGFHGDSYPVFDPSGRPHPPQVCVVFILDSYERAAGSWFQPRGQARARSIGTLDFSALGLKNRGAVLAFGDFAATHPELFAFERLSAPERVPFRERERFFASLTRDDDRFRAGDVVAIQGLKSDGKIHQHALLVERIDPVTGFPYGLADQMRTPRRRTWEAIMGPAPLRSVLYRARPSEEIWRRLSLAGAPGG